MRKHSLKVSSLIAAATLALTPLAASAITLLPPCTKSGNCAITDILAVFINIGEYLLGISGAVALAYFIWGGYQMVMSAGSAEKVKSGKDTIVRAVIGIAIIFLSGVLVRFTQQALTGREGNVCTEAQSTQGACVPSVGDTCLEAGKAEDGSRLAGSLWISLPAGVDQNDNTKVIPEGLMCIKKDESCGDLNEKLKDRGRREVYTCVSVSDTSMKILSCARGLCTVPGDTACCVCDDGNGKPTTCPKPKAK